ncbi:MAG: metallophosphoesterase, partial [Isosphaeraceae bacterium]
LRRTGRPGGRDLPEMKLGLISDLHGDPVALELAWAHLTVLGADRIVCAGDLVGYGPLPDKVVSFVKDHEIPCVRGNHDRWALERGLGVKDPFRGGAPSAETLEFLQSLPVDRLISVDGKIVVLAHGSIRSDMEFVTRENHPPGLLNRWLDQVQADVMVFGHSHEPGSCRLDRGLFVNPGSVISAPVVTTSRTFALLDLATLDVTFHDVESGCQVDAAPWSTTS